MQGAHWLGKSQGKLFFHQGQGKVREFCKMVREIRKSSKVREKSGNIKIMLGLSLKNLTNRYEMMTSTVLGEYHMQSSYSNVCFSWLVTVILI